MVVGKKEKTKKNILHRDRRERRGDREELRRDLEK
jgi:hypothetical protein